MKTQTIKQILLATLSFTFLGVLFNVRNFESLSLSYFGWNLLANLLIVFTLGAYVRTSIYSSKKIWLHTFAIFYVIGCFNILIEALIFNVTDSMETTYQLIMGIPYCAITSLVLVYIFKKWKAQPAPSQNFLERKIHVWGWRILATNIIYFIFYIMAGIILQTTLPSFFEFYQDKIPAFSDIIITNLFFRGFVFAFICILIDHTTAGTKWFKALMVGATFAIIGGIAPLIPSNEFMPAFIRLGHAIEVGVSNFLFGIISVLLLHSNTSEEGKLITKDTQ